MLCRRLPISLLPLTVGLLPTKDTFWTVANIVGMTPDGVEKGTIGAAMLTGVVTVGVAREAGTAGMVVGVVTADDTQVVVVAEVTSAVAVMQVAVTSVAVVT